MRLAYIDESYNRRSYYFAAILVREEADAQLQRELLTVPTRFAEHGIPPTAELHGYDLFHSKGDWAPLAEKPALRIHAYRLVLRAIAAGDPFIAFVGIRRDGKAAEKLNAARAGAVAELLKCLEQECLGLDERCLLVFDEEKSTSAELVQAVFSHHRARLNEGHTPRIVEAPLIVPSHHTPGVQAADLLAFLYRRRAERHKEHPMAVKANEALWRLVEPHVHREHGP